jgi:hypothetical protein
MKVEWVAYTRKNFNFPEVQKFPHRDPQEEVRNMWDVTVPPLPQGLLPCLPLKA